jgi:hypothetical protein
MLKYLAILGVLLGFAFVIARHDEISTLKGAYKARNENNPALSGKPDESHPQQNPKDSAWDSPSGHIFRRAFAWPDGTTIWAIILTLLAIAEQTQQTRKSADAALLNAQAVINAERARILFETEAVLGDDRLRGVATFTIFAVNRGKVPAEVINYGKGEICRTPTNALPGEPKYQMADPPTVRFLVPGDRHAVAEFQPGMPGNTYRLLMDVEGPPPENLGDIHLSIYGEVIYKDGISKEIRHSRYCFEWVREFRIIGGRIQPAGPPEYNEYT